jgi:hypothetical protein
LDLAWASVSSTCWLLFEATLLLPVETGESTEVYDDIDAGLGRTVFPPASCSTLSSVLQIDPAAETTEPLVSLGARAVELCTGGDEAIDVVE